MFIFILAVAATEVSVGLALIVAIYRRTGSIDPDVQWTRVEEGDD